MSPMDDAATTTDGTKAADAMSSADAIPAPPLEPGPTAGAATDAMGPPPPTADAAAAMAETVAVAAPGLPAVAPARRRLASAAMFGRLLRFAFAIALLVGGGYVGYQAYLSNRPAPAIPGDPAVVGIPTPPAVAELAAAIGADDANAIRVSLTADMFSSYASDMERFGITKVQSVETLGTFKDGERTATALVILGRMTDGSPFTINLVVIAQGGQIVRLR